MLMKRTRLLALAALLGAAAPPPAAAQVQLNGAGKHHAEER
jgi:hypothetical protein